MKGPSRALPVAASALGSLSLFKELSLDECAAIAERCTGRQFSANEEIISYKDDTNDVFFIISGKVRATIFTAAGKKVTFRDIDAGEVFGEWSAIDDNPRSSSVVALSDAFVVSMSASAFKGMVTSHPQMAWTLLRDLTVLARQLSARIVEYSALGVADRLHVELLRLASDNLLEDGSALIPAFPTNEELASRISTRREAVNRELRHLERMGLIGRDGNARIITDVSLLEEMVREAGGE